MRLPMRRARLVFLSLIALSAILSLVLFLSRPVAEEPWCARCDVILISLESVGVREAALRSPDTPMPRLAAFTRERGIVFERSYAAAPWSLPSHAALLTGEYPWNLGVWDGSDALPPGTPTLPSALSRDGYDTVMYSDGFVRPEFGFGQGFSALSGALEVQDHGPTALFAAAAKLLTASSTKPRFLFVHPDAVRLPYGTWDAASLAALHANEGGPTPEDAEAFRAAYLEELAALDDALGTFLETLEATGALDHTVIVITSGNGTRFTNRKELGLSQASLSEETLRVPSIIAVPGHSPARIDATVETRSIAATVLDIVGSGGAIMPGDSLVPLMDGRETGDRLVQAATAKDTERALLGLLQTPEALHRISSGEDAPRARLTPYGSSVASMALRGRWKLEAQQDGTRVIRNVMEDPGETRDYRNALPPPPAPAIDELVSALLQQ